VHMERSGGEESRAVLFKDETKDEAKDKAE
jgi:hypothetical protein